MLVQLQATALYNLQLKCFTSHQAFRHTQRRSEHTDCSQDPLCFTWKMSGSAIIKLFHYCTKISNFCIQIYGHRTVPLAVNYSSNVICLRNNFRILGYLGKSKMPYSKSTSIIDSANIKK